MLDRYTKGILTVIAVALTVSVIQRAVAPAEAQAPTCGSNLRNPCVVILATRRNELSDFQLCSDLRMPCLVAVTDSR